MSNDAAEFAVSEALLGAWGELTRLSNDMCKKPELSRKEDAAHDALTAFLEARGFEVERHAVLPTGFVASYAKGSDRPHVALLAEFDALPNLGHACGHNLIAVAAAGAALAVKAAMEATRLPGRVSVFGTPAAELSAGKLDFIEQRRFMHVDAALMVHPIGGAKNVLMPRFNASAAFKVIFSGKPAHAAASPWLGFNALDAAVLAYQNVAARKQQFKPQWHAAGIISRGGTAVNVIPDSTELQYSLRTPTRKELRELTEVFQDCMHGAAKATGCAVNVVDTKMCCFEMNSNKVLAETFKKYMMAAGKVQMEQEAAFANSTDMGNVSHMVPSIHPLFHINSEAQIHEHGFAEAAGSKDAFKFLLEQSQALAMTAVEVIRNRELRDAAWTAYIASMPPPTRSAPRPVPGSPTRPAQAPSASPCPAFPLYATWTCDLDEGMDELLS